MNVGIFGDSWGDSRRHYLRQPAKCWVEILQEKYNVTNFAESGSSLYFSAKTFYEHYRKFDKVIFIATDSSRLYLPEHSAIITDETTGETTRHAKFDSSMYHPTTVLQNPKNEQIFLAIKMYFAYINVQEEDNYYYSLVLADIESKMASDKLLLLSKMFHIYHKEEDYYRSQGYDANVCNERKNCHMTDSNNRRLAELVDEWLQTGKTNLRGPSNSNVNTDLFYDPVDEPFEKYYRA